MYLRIHVKFNSQIVHKQFILKYCVVVLNVTVTASFKLINSFVTMFTVNMHFKDGRHEPTYDKKYDKNKEVNYIVQNAVGDILQEEYSKTLSENSGYQEH